MLSTNSLLFHLSANEIYNYLALLLRFFNQSLEDRLRQHDSGINALQYGVLRMLQAEVLTISEVSQRLGVDQSTLVRSVDSLEAKGLVRRGRDPRDRRRNPLSITADGQQLLDAVPLVAADDSSLQALQALGDESLEALKTLLMQLVYSFPEGKIILDSFAQQTPENHSKQNI